MRRSTVRTTLGRLRLSLGLGQKELADRLGVSTSHIQKIELKKLPLSRELAMRLWTETDVSPEWLLKGEPTSQPVTIDGEVVDGDTVWWTQWRHRLLQGDPLMTLEVVQRALFPGLVAVMAMAIKAYRDDQLTELGDEIYRLCGHFKQVLREPRSQDAAAAVKRLLAAAGAFQSKPIRSLRREAGRTRVRLNLDELIEAYERVLSDELHAKREKLSKGDGAGAKPKRLTYLRGQSPRERPFG
jgi:transcriptional regulator with XRE-family HTH domain